MIGSSSGQQYETEMDAVMGRPITQEDQERSLGRDTMKDEVDKRQKAMQPTDDYRKGIHEQQELDMFKHSPTERGAAIDREHHVPLVASALTDDNGDMYGMAIDHRVPPKPEFEKHLWDHEAYENEYMNHLVKIGYTSQDAYHKAHDWSTARESAAVEAEFGKQGLEDYKQHWRDAAKIASEPSEMERHPDAHTTRHGLDESETGQKFPKEALFRGLQGAGISATDATKFNEETDHESFVHKIAPSEFGGSMRWFKGAEGKWRQEIPDVNAKVTPDKANANLNQNSKMYGSKHTTLEYMLDHPELFKAYPQLKNLTVKGKSGGEPNSAFYRPGENTIYLRPYTSEAMLKKTLLHEVQHAIQAIEGFTGGASVAGIAPYAAKAIINKNLKFKSDAELEGALKDVAFGAYQHVAGEVESRNVEKRSEWPIEALKIFKPEFTQDYPHAKQLNSPK